MRRLPLFTDSPLRRILALSLLAAVAPACGGGGSSAPIIVLPFYISTSGLPNGMVNTNYSQTISTGSGTAPVTWSILNGALPAGAPAFGIAAASGTTAIISGKPLAPAGMSSFTVRAIDANGLIADRVFSITVLGGLAIPVAVTSPAILPAGTQGSLYTTGLDASGGTPPYTWSITGGALPVGLSLNQSIGQISGVPSVAGGPTSFTVQVKDSLGAPATALLSISISPTLFVTTPTLPDTTTTSTTYNQALAESGGTAPFAWSIIGGALPTGLTLSPAGVISGTVTGAAGIYGFTAEVTDASSAQVSKSFTILVNPVPTITTTTLVPWTQGFAGYSQTMQFTGGTAPITWSITGGTLPAGLLLAPATGAITGLPTGTGTSNFTAVATDAVGVAASQPLFIVINPAEVVSPGSLPPWTVNRPGYSQTITAAGGTGARALTLISGAVPTGMIFTPATGVLTGTPTVQGTFSFTVRSTDTLGAQGHTDYSVVISPPPSILTTSLPNWTVSRLYSQTLLTTPVTGTAPFTWAITAGTQPAGLLLSTGGVLSGTPTTPGLSTFTVTVTDAAGATATQQYSNLTINPTPGISTTSLPNWTVNRAYTQTLLTTAATGTAPFTWAITAGTQPAGLLLSAGGVLSGTPTTPGLSTFTVTVTDAAGATATQQYSNLTINATPVIGTALPNWTVNRAYTQALSTGATGTTPFTWAITAGTQPAGLLLSTGGVLSGTPTAPGLSTFTVTVTDSAGATATRTYTNLTINPTPTISTTSLPNWTVNRAYTQTLLTTPATGTAPFTWAITAGTQPAGLLLSTGGVLSGTPTTPGLSTFTVTVTDAAGASAFQQYSNLTINPAPTISTASLPNWTVSRLYSQTLLTTPVTGTAPFTWAITAGTQPAGLLLSTGGVLSGTPTTPGLSTFTVTVTDAAGATATQQYSNLTINPTPTISTTSLPNWTVNRAYTQTLLTTPATGTTPFTWAITAGTQPAGLLLSTGGVLSGTPTAPGLSTFTVTVTDAAGAMASQQYSNLTINPAPTILTTTLPDWTQGFAFLQTLLTTPATGTVPFTWAITAGTQPAGLLLSTGGVLSGTPTTQGQSTFTVTVTDAAGATATQAYTNLTINAALNIATGPPLAPWTQNFAGYSQTMTATGGTGGQTWTMTGGSYPPGLAALTTGGVIAGTPTAAGTFNFTVKVTDGVGATALQLTTIVVNPALNVQNTTPMQAWTQGQPGYSQTLTANGGTGGQTWTMTGGSYPPGLAALTTGGVIAGTPTVSGTYFFTVQVADGLGATGSKVMAIVINDPLAITTPSPMAAWTENFPGYSQTLGASGGTGTLTWSVTSGTYPSGLNALTTGGLIAGTPSLAANYSFTVQVTDFAGATATKTLAITINAALSFVTTTPLPGGTQGVFYSQSLAVSGGTGALSFSKSSGSIPTGLTFSVGGLLNGIPTGTGLSSFGVTVSDSIGASAVTTFGVTINPGPLVITTSLLPEGRVGSGYNAAVQVTGGVAPYAWSVSAGTLPVPLSLAPASGIISGMPAAIASVSVTIQVTDSSTPSAQTVSQAYTFHIDGGNVAQGGLTINTLRLPDASIGVAYSQQVQGGFFGTPPVTLTIDPSSNLLPASLTMAADGTVHGTPAPGDEGEYTFTVMITDSSVPPLVARANVLLVVGDPPSPLTILTPSMSDGTEGVAYPTTKLIVSGGRPPYTWDTAQDSPETQGLVLTTSGIFYGTPRQHGTFTIIFRVWDSSLPSRNVTKTLTFTIAPPATGFIVDSPNPPSTTDGTPGYSYQFTTSAGTPKLWIADTGNLSKAGLNFDMTLGQITGNPSASGVFQFIVGAVADGPAPRPSSLTVATLVINPQPFGITTTSLPDIIQGQPYSAFLTETGGGPGPFTWYTDPSKLPSNIMLNGATGEIHGTTTSGGNGHGGIMVSVTSGLGTRWAFVPLSVAKSLPSINGGFGPGIQTYTLNQGAVGAPYPAAQFSVSNTDQDRTQVTVRNGYSLPAGMVLDPARRQISGTPTLPGRYILRLDVTDTSGNSGGSQPTIISGESSAILEILLEAGFRISTRNLHAGRERVAYLGSIVPEGGSAATPYSFAVSSGSLPPGLVLDAVNGTLSGTPTAAGTYAFVITVTQNASVASMAYELPVDPALAPISIVTDRLPNATVGADYQGGQSARGAVTGWSDAGSPTTFGALGLGFNHLSGDVIGTPTAPPGLYTIQVTVTDGVTTSTRSVILRIDPLAIDAIGFLGTGFVGQTFSITPQAFGGVGPYTVDLASGEQLSPGLTMTAGTIGGIGTVSTSFTQVLLKIQDSTGRSGYGRADYIIVGPDAPVLGFQPSLNNEIETQVGGTLSAGDQTFDAQNGTAPYTYAAPPAAQRPGDLVPPGLSISTTTPPPGNGQANVVGIPTASGVYSFMLRVTDSAAATADQVVNVVVRQNYNSLDPTVDSHRLPDGIALAPYPNTQLSGFANGAHGATWAFTPGQNPAPPAGLNLSPQGVISSGGLSSGTYYFFVRHSDPVRGTFADGRIMLLIQ